ncbi:AzlC family ABC transporter permease [Kineosporia rhizophila]|uniref:AzlC family ABC transporter permease n=1 Tax=Kineosporia rhizophila TaxID=84633 RepID=UPI0022B7EFCF|nr:AzlC family ABC transporter permease [Kineosporia rhizophila]
MRSVWRTVDRERTRVIALLCVADGLVAVSFGAVAVGGGLAPWIPIALSILVFAGGAQFAAVGTVLSGGSATAAVVTGLLLNARLLPFSFSVSDVIRGRSPLKQAVGAQIVTDETVAMAIAERDPERRAAAFWVCGLCLFVCWNLGVLIGAGLGAQIGDTDALGLDAAFPAVLVAIVLPALNTRRLRLAAGIGSAAAVASAPVLAAGLPVLASLTGLAALARRRAKKSKSPAEEPRSPEVSGSRETPRSAEVSSLPGHRSPEISSPSEGSSLAGRRSPGDSPSPEGSGLLGRGSPGASSSPEGSGLLGRRAPGGSSSSKGSGRPGRGSSGDSSSLEGSGLPGRRSPGASPSPEGSGRPGRGSSGDSSSMEGSGLPGRRSPGNSSLPEGSGPPGDCPPDNSPSHEGCL